MKRMLNTYRLAWQVDGTVYCNSVLYFLQQIPLIGRAVRDSAYRAGQVKLVLTGLFTVFKLIGSLVRKLLFYFAFLLPGIVVAADEGLDIAGAEQGDVRMMCWIVLMMNVLAGSVLNHAVQPKGSETSMVKLVYLDLNKRDYYIFGAIVDYAGYAVLSAAALAAVGWLYYRAPLASAVLLTVETIEVRIFADGLGALPGLSSDESSGRDPGLLLTVILLIAAYVPVVTDILSGSGRTGGMVKLAADVLLTPAGPALCLIPALAGIFLLRHRADYESIAKREIRDWQRLQQDLGKLSENSAYRIDEKSLGKKSGEAIVETGLSRIHGYEYLQKLFLRRHQKLFRRRIILMLFISALILIAAVVMRIAGGGSTLFEVIGNEVIGVWIFAVYLIAYRDSYTKALFSNIDRYLLHYNWYRKPEVIVRNYFIRLRSSFAMNCLLVYPVMLAVIGGMFITGAPKKALPMFILTLTVLSLFYSVHYLTLYYLVQPYTDELQQKGFIYKLANGLVYIASYTALQEHAVSDRVLIPVSAIVVIYLAITVILLRRLGPKSFRLK